MNYTLKDLSVMHDYYCSDNNYYSNDAGLSYPTFKEFLDEFKDSDVDMNLVFRWDLILHDDDNEGSGYCMEIFQMKQRKGIFTPIMINEFTEDDISSFIEYITPHLYKLQNLWKPFKF